MRASHVALLVLSILCPGICVAQTETVIYNFSGGDGNGPSGPLIQASDGNFYGGTTFGGSGSYGVVYKVNAAGSTFSDVYSFDNDTNGSEPEGHLIQGSDGNFYGTTTFNVFKLTPGGVITVLAAPGGNPEGLITASDGNYYFITSFGSGIYKITASTGEVTELSAAPYGGFNLYNVVQGTDGNLYGTELGGGTGGANTIFKCTLAGVASVLYTFPSNLYPTGGIVVGPDGQLYGTVGDNSNATAGQFYKVNPANGNYTDLYTLPASDNLQLPTQLMTASDGNLYGIAQSNGDTRELIQLTPSGTFTQLLSISNPGEVNNPLVQGTDGALYGTGANGGNNTGDGAVFKIALSPALTAPVTLTLGKSSVVQGASTTLTWSVSGAYGGSAGYCVAGGTDPEWTGAKAASGQVTLTPAAVGAFTYTLTCGGSISNSTSLTVTSNGKVNTTTMLAASPNPVTIGNMETLTATVAPTSGNAKATGTVTFSVGSTTVGSATLNGSGVAMLSAPTTGLSAGVYPVVATYGGSSSLNGSSSSAVNVTLTSQVATTVSVSASPTGTVEGGNITLSATVKPVSGTGTPGGSITFSAAGETLPSVALNSKGVATFTASTSGVPPATYTVTANYGGSSAYEASSGTTSVIVEWPTTTTLMANPNPVVQGSNVTVTATVSRTGGSGVPSGTVKFMVGTTVLGSATLSGGTASLTASTSAVSQGTYPVTATYSGDANDGGSTSAALNVTVN
jgi:uncharacterized repeat protein (TIGR03803 family)